ncbi:Clp protease N-terminal domain-containing protein [Streptomyces sp. NPDC049040]|uniref:Clp protease N-terminal domain-containing protein n=1 Tax=Streptomyces sp. NPDC049040 TaxID=3365593 RepID=UPI0037111401
MSPFPVDPAALISHVESLHPSGGPLDHLADAAAVSARLDEQADALLGHFVEQARRAGASWAEIGAGFGVSKQAARKRFLPRWDGSDPIPDDAMYSRFTKRARNTVVAAAWIARQAGGGQADVVHLAAGLLAEPEALAAEAIHAAGVSDERFCRALGLDPAAVTVPSGGTGSDIGSVDLTGAARETLRDCLRVALRLGHNFIGTEHLLLGLLSGGGPTAHKLTSLGLDTATTERWLLAEIARIQAARQGK